MMDNAAAARLMGCKESEVASVADSPAGTVIVTTDGVSSILVPEDCPDAEGKTGLMLLAAPSEHPVAVINGRSVWNAYPLYVSPVPLTEESDAAEADAEDVRPSVHADLDELPIGELRDLAKHHDLDVDMRSKQAIIDALAPLFTAEESDAG